jgi:hypothetical protein
MSKRADGDTSWHREQIRKACRGLFAAEGTVEEALDAVLQAAQREFGVRVIFTAPALMRIDGCEYRWPDA